MNAILNVLRRQRRGHPAPIWRHRPLPAPADLRLARAALPDRVASELEPWEESMVPPRGERPAWEA